MHGTNRWEEVQSVTAYPTLVLRNIEESTRKKCSSTWKVATCVDAVHGKAEKMCSKLCGISAILTQPSKTKGKKKRFPFFC